MQAWRPAALHFVVSSLVIAIAAYMVFVVWFPAPLDQLADGRNVLWILACVDLVSGPLLTFIVASPGKSRIALWGDLTVIGLVQAMALGYGVLALYDARPVYLAFEGDRFRVVSVPDIDSQSKSTGGMLNQPLPKWGPSLIGVKMLEPSDPRYLQSLEQSVNGNHPAFRPERWVPYSDQRQVVIKSALPIGNLTMGGDAISREVAEWLHRNNQTQEDIVYLPLANHKEQDWIILLKKLDGEPVGFLAVDGWS